MGLFGEGGKTGTGVASKSHADRRRTSSSGVGPPSGPGDSSPSPVFIKNKIMLKQNKASISVIFILAIKRKGKRLKQIKTINIIR